MDKKKDVTDVFFDISTSRATHISEKRREVFSAISERIKLNNERNIIADFHDFVCNHRESKEELRIENNNIASNNNFLSKIALLTGQVSGVVGIVSLLGNLPLAAGLAAVCATSFYAGIRLESEHENYSPLKNIDDIAERDRIEFEAFFKSLNDKEMEKGIDSYNEYIEKIKKENPELYTQLAINVGGDVLKGYVRHLHSEMLKNGEDEYVSKLKNIKLHINSKEHDKLIKELSSEFGEEFDSLNDRADNEAKIEKKKMDIKLELELQAMKEKRNQEGQAIYNFKNNSDLKYK